MDPYLEDPGGWAGVHDPLVAVMREQLNERLGPGFIADGGTSVYIITHDEQRWVFPDVYLIETGVPGPAPPSRGSIATPVRVRLVAPEAISQPHILIRDRATRQVVTLIEVLSPINKAPAATQARQDFLRKRTETMASATNWLEIDLLRMGERPPEVRGAGPYYAAYRRVGEPDLVVWPFSLREPLPVIGVPLLPGHADVELDLQAVLDLLFARYRYTELIDYTMPPPPPPFALDDGQWIEEQVRRWLAARATDGTAQ
jgi:hypothetical protein